MNKSHKPYSSETQQSNLADIFALSRFTHLMFSFTSALSIYIITALFSSALDLYTGVRDTYFSRFFQKGFIATIMSDTEAAPPAAKSPAKTKSSKKKKNKKGPTSHPKYNKMIAETIAALKERGGSSRQAILKYILLNYDVGKDEKTVNNHLKMSLRAGIKNGKLYQSKGTGASGEFFFLSKYDFISFYYIFLQIFDCRKVMHQSFVTTALPPM